MSMIGKIKKVLFGQPQREVTQTSVTREDKERIPEHYKKKVAEAEAKHMKLEEKVQKLQKKLEKAKQRADRERKQRMDEKEYVEVDEREIDIGKLLEHTRNGGEVDVLSREHMWMGYLHTIKAKQEGDKLVAHIVTRDDDGSYYSVISGFNPFNLIHRQTGLVDSLKTGTIVVNRSFHSRQPIPDSFVTEYGEPKHVESILQEKQKEISKMRQQMENAAKREEKERTRRKEEKLGKEVQKTRADAMTKNVLSDIKDFANSLGEYRELHNKLHEEQSRNQSLENQVQSFQKTTKEMFEVLEDQAPKNEVEKAREEIMGELDRLSDLAKPSDSSKEGEE